MFFIIISYNFSKNIQFEKNFLFIKWIVTNLHSHKSDCTFCSNGKNAHDTIHIFKPLQLKKMSLAAIFY